MNWSGGKDSALALQQVLEGGEFDVSHLITSVNSHWQRVSMHGVRRDLLRRQADAIGIDLIEILLPEMPSMEVYEAELNQTLDRLVDNGVTHSIFGDIFLEDLREYREKQLERKGLSGIFPLWKVSTADLIQEFLDLGSKAITVCVDGNKLDKSFCGRVIDRSFINDLPKEVDVCGENGEFHTFVFQAPYFSKQINFTIGEIVYRKYPAAAESGIASEFYFCDLLPE